MIKLRKVKEDQMEIGDRNRNGGILYVYYRRIY